MLVVTIFRALLVGLALLFLHFSCVGFHTVEALVDLGLDVLEAGDPLGLELLITALIALELLKDVGF